tara:strand:- start:3363 stop:5522 length:2160 start_codon:yes stop_codon:yes gene_type:complete
MKPVIWMLCLIAVHANSSINNYIFPDYGPSFNHHGEIGLIQTPNARFKEAGTLAFVFRDIKPYKRGVITAFPFDWLQASYRYVDVEHTLYSQSFAFSGLQTLKDKGFDAKIKLMNERGHFPAVAVGLRDLAGTGRFSSEYIVASKKMSDYVDLSVGLATGFLGSGDNVTNPFSRISDRFNSRNKKRSRGAVGGEFAYETWFAGPASLFAGAEIILPYARGAVLKIEYDPNDYIREGGKRLLKESDYNIGLSIPLAKNNIKAFVSWDRGNTIGFGISVGANLSRQVVKKSRTKIQIEEQFNYSKNNNVRSRAIFTNSLKHLRDQNIFLQKIEVDKPNETSTVVFSENTFGSNPESITTIFEVLDKTHPKIIKNFNLIKLNAAYSDFEVSIDRGRFRDSLDANQVFNISNSFTVSSGPQKPVSENISAMDENTFSPKIKFPFLSSNTGVAMRNHIGGPDAFYFGQLFIRNDSELTLSRRIFWKNSIGISIWDNFDDLKLNSDSILPHVRTDIVKYLKQGKNGIMRSQINFVDEIRKDIFFKASAGIFEEMFSGYGFEFLYRPFKKNYAVGFDTYNAYQRNYDQDFGVMDYSIVTGHLSLYKFFPTQKILFTMRGGRYLAGDSGITMDFSRKFNNGLQIGAFFTRTDISKAEFGEGSFDKGFYFLVPVQVFTSSNAKHRTNFGLRPLTRDGGQRLIVGSDLYTLTDSASYLNFFNQNDEFFE